MDHFTERAATRHCRPAFQESDRGSQRVPEHFVVHVSADSLFILNVNQREVGRGPARSDLAHWKYETYDLAPFLRPGRNEIAATVWSLGVSTGAQISDRTALCAQRCFAGGKCRGHRQ